MIAENYDYDWYTAKKEYQRAIQLNPNYLRYCPPLVCRILGVPGEVRRSFAGERSHPAAGPALADHCCDRGAVFCFSRYSDRAIEQFRAVQQMEPNFPRSPMVIFAYVEKGRFADTLAEIENWRPLDPTPGTWAVEAYVYARSGQQTKGRRMLEKMKEASRQRRLDPAPMLSVAYAMKDTDKAFIARRSLLRTFERSHRVES
jgi:hypothetical protein